MSQDSIITPHFLLTTTNLAPRRCPPKHIRQKQCSDSGSSTDTSSNSDNSTEAPTINTWATTPTPQRIPDFPLCSLFRDLTIYSSHKFVEFRPGQVSSTNPHIRFSLFRHYTHAHSLEHSCFCHDYLCPYHC
jgi:hypothetical protein